ncbi:MAG: S8 family serine peptidase [Bdellovibrionales bacterium]|nr:S8 family serine peptidase [Bdellovibrionales bacterium]
MPSFVRNIEKNGKLKIALHKAHENREDGGFPFPIPGMPGNGDDGGGGGGLPFPIPGFPGDGGGDDGNGGLPFPIPGFPGEGGDGGNGGGFPGLPGGGGGGSTASGDPAIPTNFVETTGPDKDSTKQWGMTDIGLTEAWNTGGTQGSAEIVVAVIDTGIDYTHEDLAKNIWRNPGETGTDGSGKDKATNGVDDDNNGYIDDVVGWDFAKNDSKPYDTKGANPGHGTHCAGNIGAAVNNGKGIVGIAPNVKMMALRFLTEKGEGDIAGALKAIKYGADNGARILSNSWGSEGDGTGDGQNDEEDAAASKALQDVISYAKDKGVLFIAAAGNGKAPFGIGYDNDTDKKPAFPASYDVENIVSVAALNSQDRLGQFSNWGKRTVDIGAPGVGVYSTVPGNKYMNMDGTSMACPHVAGAAALYWSKHPNATWLDVKNALIQSAKPISALNNKSVSGGKLDLRKLMSM